MLPPPRGPGLVEGGWWMISAGGGERSRMCTVAPREQRSWVVARPMPDEPPGLVGNVIRIIRQTYL